MTYALFKNNPIFIVNLKWVVFQLCLLPAFTLYILFLKNEIRIDLHEDLPFLTLITAFTVSSFTSVHVPVSVSHLVHIISLFIFYFILSRSFIFEGKVDEIIDVVIAAGTITALYSLAQHIGFDPLGLTVLQSREASSTFINWNLLAGYLIYSIPLIVYKLLTVNNIIPSFLYGLSLFIHALCLIYTKSRGGWLGLIGSMAMFCILFMTTKADIKKLLCRLFFSVSIPAFILLILFAGSDAGIAKRFKSITDFSDPSIKMRFVLYLTTIDMIKEHPLIGSGPDTYKLIHPKYQSKYFKDKRYKIFKALSLYTHNDYLQIWGETGILGIFSFLWIIISVFRKGLMKLEGDRYGSLRIIAVLSSLTALLIHSIFHYPFYMPATGMLYWLAFAFIRMAPLDSKNKNPKRLYRLSINTYKKAGAISIFFSLAMYSFVLFLGNIYCEKGVVQEQDGDYWGAVASYKESIMLNPFHADTYYFSGNTYFYLNKIDKAIDMYKKALIQNPFFQHVYNQLGVVYMRKGLEKEAEDMLKKAVYISPNFENPLYSLGLLYDSQQRYNEAIDSFKRVIAIAPNSASAHYNLANIYYKTESVDAAIYEYKKALSLKPDFPDAHKNIGVVYAYRKKMYKEAIAHWTKYLKSGISDEEEKKIRSEIVKMKAVVKQENATD